jgi:hypothetical protein
LLSGWGRYSVPVKPNLLTPHSNTDHGPTRQPLRVGEPGACPLPPIPAPRRRPSPIQGVAQTSSLSAAYKDNDRWKISSPLHRICLPTEVSIAAACRQLAVALPDHSTIPLVELLLTPSCSFCPRFHDHRARAPASTTHPMGDLHRH